MKRATGRLPLVLVDGAIPQAPFGVLEGIAELARFAGEEEIERWIDRRGEEIAGLGVQLTTRVDEALLARLPMLRVVANYAVGTDNVDLDAARRRGLVVTHTPDVLTETTADLTWALILAVARRVIEGDRLARSGEWTGWHPGELLGKELAGATLGILGMGRIGEAVARRAAPFRMRIAYWSRTARPDLERALEARRMELDAAIAAADVVSIHLPLTTETHHLIDARLLALAKPSAIVVNTSRGPIVDEDALAQALDSGRLGGAGLDVHEHEPRIHPGLAASTRTVLLPHLGSATVETRERMAAIVARNLRAVLEGSPPTDPVPERGD